MKRFRLSTLLLLVVIASLVLALVVQHNRAARREAEQRELTARREAEFDAEADDLIGHMSKLNYEYTRKLLEKEAELVVARGRPAVETTEVKGGDK
jgi:hypothetical protein